MSEQKPEMKAGAAATTAPVPTRVRRDRLFLVVIIGATALITFLVSLLLTNIFERKQEARNPYLRLVEVTEETTDPEPWGVNWPREYDSYKRTAELTRTRFGGHGGSEAMPVEKAERDPWLTRAFAGYAFSIDYRDRRGHAYMLSDQEITRRVTERDQPGACLHCHASIIPTYRRIGKDAMGAAAAGAKDADVVFTGFAELSKKSYKDAHAELVKTGSMNPQLKGKEQVMTHGQGAHPVSCVDCHDPKSMQLRVTRPGFIKGIGALAQGQGAVIPGSSLDTWRKNGRKGVYDPNVNATRQEMRTFVCAQCHVEYYCGPKNTDGNGANLFFPWANGVKVEDIEDTYSKTTFTTDKHRFYDWTHAETGAELLKAQHPEFELYSQGVHAQAGVSCADCHMPYERQGAMKVSDHWVRSPMLNIAKSCQTCHPVAEAELKRRVDVIQDRSFGLLDRSGKAAVEFFDTVKVLRKPFDEQNRAAADAEGAAKEPDIRAKLAATLAADEKHARLPEDQRAAALEAKVRAKVAEAKAQALNERWARKVAGDPALKAMAELHRKAQWRLDFIAAENSMGFHAPQESARILGESIDYFRQAKEQANLLRLGGTAAPTQPIVVTPTQTGITGPLDPNQSGPPAPATAPR